MAGKRSRGSRAVRRRLGGIVVARPRLCSSMFLGSGSGPRRQLFAIAAMSAILYNTLRLHLTANMRCGLIATAGRNAVRLRNTRFQLADARNVIRGQTARSRAVEDRSRPIYRGCNSDTCLRTRRAHNRGKAAGTCRQPTATIRQHEMPTAIFQAFIAGFLGAVGNRRSPAGYLRPKSLPNSYFFPKRKKPPEPPAPKRKKPSELLPRALSLTGELIGRGTS